MDHMILTTHPRIPLTAPAWAWTQAGYGVSQDGTMWEGRSPFGFDRVLLIAISRGLDGVAAIGWALEEHRRRGEERTRVTAQAREADGLRELAAALKGVQESDVLDWASGYCLAGHRLYVEAPDID